MTVKKWEHTIAFYDMDKQISIRMAPKITEKQVNVPAFITMKCSLAAQILSHSVVTDISDLCIQKYLPEEVTL